MYNETFLSDNEGNRVTPGVASGDPVLASGIKITDGTIGADHTQTLVAGAMYQISATEVGGFIMGIATVDTAANILWHVPRDGRLMFKMPSGYTALYYQGLTNSAVGYITRMK